jgi:SAM-dependent methyltransferase
MNKSIEHVKKIAYSYDINIQLHKIGMNQYKYLPNRYFNDPAWKDLVASDFNSDGKDIKRFLKPQASQNYIDLGCYINLINLELHKWPCVYYGVDISGEIIKVLKEFVKREKIPIGGLYKRGLDKLPFKNKLFQIGTCINVLEYHDKEYVNIAMKEIHRVLDINAKFVCDIPNKQHPAFKLMLKIENYLGRPNLFQYQRSTFERMIKPLFDIVNLNDKELMIRYYLKRK